MAKFFFNFRQGDAYQADDVGCEFASVEDAYLGAFGTAQEMWRELLVQREDPLLCAYEVTDEEGRDLFALPFLEVLEACRGRTHALRYHQRNSDVIQQALKTRAKTLRAMNEVSSAVAKARATLGETRDLLAQVSKIVES